MNAAEKMMAFGMKALAERTGRDLSIIYRWRKALLDGRGVSDGNKQLLIDATRESDQAIAWSDFAPRQMAEAA